MRIKKCLTGGIYPMASIDTSTKISEELTRESLIAISQSAPEKAHNPNLASIKSADSNGVNGDYGGWAEKYRSKLISISYTQSPDTQPLPCSVRNIRSSAINFI